MDDSGNQIFNYEEALDTFPTVRSLTADAVARLQALYAPIQSQDELARRRDELDLETRRIIDGWVQQVEGLGCVVKGLWLVDWDTGSGYYCWRWPEETLGHYHGYEEGFAGRVPLQ